MRNGIEISAEGTALPNFGFPNLPHTDPAHTYPPPQLPYPLKPERSSSTKADGLRVWIQLSPQN